MSSEDLARIAQNKNVARAAARQLSMDQLTKLAEVINEVIEQKKADEQHQQDELKQKEAKLAEIREAMSNAGVSLDDLVAEQPKRRGRPPKKR